MKHIKGNLLDFPAGINVLVHQANIEGNMGAGIAAQIARRFPVAADVDRAAFKSGTAKLGEFSVAYLKGNNSMIVNLYGQSIRRKSRAGIPTDYNAVWRALEGLNDFLLEQPKHIIKDSFSGKFVIGVPKFMGCALGGGNWNVYSTIIEETVGHNFPVVCVEFDMKG